MLDQTSLVILAVSAALIPPLIEMLGPTEGDRANIAKAKRQISTILSTAVGIAVSMLESGGVDASGDGLTSFLVAAVFSKVGVQAMHDGYWTDKNVVQLRKPEPEAGHA